jgi:serpin B
MKPLLLMLIPPVFMQAAAMFTPPPPAALPTDDQSELVAGSNAFAIELYAQLRQQAGNLFFSPASISTALAMTYAGASGSTAAEMQHALHFTLPPARLHPAIGTLLGKLNAAHTSYQLRVADALWAQQDETFLPAYLALTQTNYAAGFHPVDFVKDPEKVRQTINQWIEQQTGDKIKDLLKPGVVTAATRLVLTNAIYFKGDWQSQFDKTQTKEEDFHLSTQQTVRAPLMHRQAKLNYFNGGTFQVVEIPYKSSELSMIVFLPNDPTGLPAFEQSLTPPDLQKWLGLLQPASKVILTLPRFNMTQQFELNDALSALGMKQAFVQGAADFSAMTGKRDLFISTAIHKAFIEVNEEGTEAAAATSTVMRTLSMRRDPQPVVFRADHPFLFLIRDNPSGAILFMGRVEAPSH